MTVTTHRTPIDQLDVNAPSSLAYEMTEEARLFLDGAEGDLGRARTLAAEAAYYLSDTIEPDDRGRLLSLAEDRHAPSTDGVRSTEAFTLLADAAVETEGLLRGPSASSELRIALRALRDATRLLAEHLEHEAGSPTAGDPTPGSEQGSHVARASAAWSRPRPRGARR